MKKVLIPTDFTEESLQLLEYAILNFPNTRLEITLVNGFRLPETRWGLFHYSDIREVNKLIPDSFVNAKKVFVREHSDVIHKLNVELFTGSNSFAFRNFIEQLGVADAIVPKDKFLLSYPNKCFDTTRLIKKNVPNIIEIPLERPGLVPNTGFSLSGLLNL